MFSGLRRYGLKPWGLREHLFAILCLLLLGLYAVGLFISAQDLRRNFEREYVQRAKLLGSAIDTGLSSPNDLVDSSLMQRHLDQLRAAETDIVRAQIYLPQEEGLVVTASTDRGAVGHLGDSEDLEPLLTNRVQVAERSFGGVHTLEFNAPLHLAGEPAGVIGIYIDLGGRDALIANHLLKFAGLGALAMFLVGAALYVYLNRAVVRPIGQLAKAAEALGSGRLDVQVPTRGASEVRQLTATFNEMARAIATMDVEQKNLLDKTLHLHFDSIQTLAAAVDARDHYTNGHSKSMAGLAALIARELGLTSDEVERIRFAGLLHDVGKIGVPDDVLKRRGALDDEARATIMAHPAVGASILAQAGHLKYLAPLVRHHHERYDGCGYPDRLRGEGIPLGARILAVADAFDAMTSDRHYRRALDRAAAIDELVALRGRQFDPAVVDALLRVLGGKLTPETVPVGGCWSGRD